MPPKLFHTGSTTSITTSHNLNQLSKPNKTYLTPNRGACNNCTHATFFQNLSEKTRNQVETYNIGSEDQTNVKTIAETVIKEMKLQNVRLKLTGGVDGGGGWKGDVKIRLLDVTKIKSLGWKPTLNSTQAVKQTAKT